MIDWFSENYLWIKALHLIAVIAWMAGLFYLPRILVYFVENKEKPDCVSMLTTMGRRLFHIIMQPAMILSLATGGILVIVLQAWSSGWLHLKLLAVVLLVLYHFMLKHWLDALISGNCQRSSTFFRILNEIPTALLIVIVIAVIVKPF